MKDHKTVEAKFAEECEIAFRSVCAKLGITDAVGVCARGTVSQLHEQRKIMRRTSNKIRDSIGQGEPTQENLDALTHIGFVINRIDGLIEASGFIAGGPGSARSSKEDWRDANGERVRVMRKDTDFHEVYQSRARAFGEGDDAIGIDDWFRGVANMPTTPAVKAALSEGTNSAGGYTVPSLVMPDILRALTPVSSLLQAGAGIVDLNDGAKSFTTAAINAIPAAAWRAEAGSVAQSDPAFRAVVAAPTSLAFYFKISRELLADGVNIQQALMTAIGAAFAKELDRAGLRGTGTAPEPRGILNVSGIQSVTNGANGASLATTAYANFVSAVQSLLAADSPMPSAAIMAPRSVTTLGGLLDTTNQPRARPGLLDPVKFIATSQIPTNLTVGTSTDCSEIYVGDFANVVFAMRERVSVQLLKELFAATGEIGFMCHVRADVMVLYPAAFAVVTGVRA